MICRLCHGPRYKVIPLWFDDASMTMTDANSLALCKTCYAKGRVAGWIDGKGNGHWEGYRAYLAKQVVKA